MYSEQLTADPNTAGIALLPEVTATAINRWYILHTRSRQEKVVALALGSMGVDHYLPLVTRVQFYGKRKVKVKAPLFPGYLFLHGMRDQAFDVDRTGRIAQIIDVPDQAQLAFELKNIQLALKSDTVLDPYPYLHEGIHVEVRSGPFRGIQGLIESRTKCHRLILQVDVLGQASSLEIDGSLLEPIE